MLKSMQNLLYFFKYTSNKYDACVISDQCTLYLLALVSMSIPPAFILCKLHLAVNDKVQYHFFFSRALYTASNPLAIFVDKKSSEMTGLMRELMGVIIKEIT